MITSEQVTVCAWCTPSDENTPEETSHGICAAHAEQIELDYQLRSWNRVPSYVEEQAAQFAAEEGE